MNQNTEQFKLELSQHVVVTCAYWGIKIFSISLWFVLWWHFVGFEKLRLGIRWYIPVFLFTAMEALEIVVKASYHNSSYIEEKLEAIKQVENNAGRVIPAIVILAAVPAFFLKKENIPLPTEFFSFLIIAATILIGGSLSWFADMGKNSSLWTVVFVGQLKVESYRHVLIWILSAIISLYCWMDVLGHIIVY